MKSRRLLGLLLSLCLLAGCGGTAEAPAAPPSPTPASPVPVEPEPAPPEEGGGKKLLFLYQPETGCREILHGPDCWLGDMTLEAVSPSGNRLLTAANLGGDGFRITAILSLYDREADRLVNLRCPGETGGEAGREFPGIGEYRFLGEDTLLDTNLLVETGGGGAAEVRFYRIEEDGALTRRVAALECPPLAEEADYGKAGYRAYWLPEQKGLMARLCTQEGWEWLVWEAESGRLLSRSPAEKAERCGVFGQLREGGIYWIDFDWGEETLSLRAYHVAEDRAETLATGPIPYDPEVEKGALGYWLNVRLHDIRDGVFLLRAGFSLGPAGWREAAWDSSVGGPVVFEKERQQEPVLPAEWEDARVLAALPDGRLLALAGG